MDLTFLGAAGEVGRSCMFLNGEDKIMLDCGLKIHSDSTFPLTPPANPDYFILSHAHLDHSGFVPSLYRESNPDLFCTPPTLALSQIIVEDSMRIMEKRGEHPYRPAHVKRMLNAARLTSYGKWQEIGESRFMFYSAGHIPGAAVTDIETSGKRVVYSGDFKLEETHTTFATDLPPSGPDVLIMESTYASKEHPSRKDMEIELGKQLAATLELGGSVLLPAFAIGRTQELVRIVRSVDKDVDIWIDGMGWEVSETLERFSGYIKDFKKFRHDMQSCRHISHRSQRGHALKKPGVIISTAGMLQGGPALGYLLRMGPESKAIFTGYCVKDTNGYNLLNSGFVEYDGVKIKPKATWSYLDFSAHAGRKELFEFAEKLAPTKIYCVHGDSTQQFADELALEGFDASAPKLGDTVQV